MNKPSSRKSLPISESSASFRYILVIPDYWKDDDVDTIFKNSDNLNKQKESNNIQVYQTSDIRNRDFLTPIPCFEAHPSFHIVSPSFFNPGLYVRSENGSNVFLKASDFSRDVLLLKAKRIEITLACNNVSEATIDLKWLLDSQQSDSKLISISGPGATTVEASTERNKTQIELRNAKLEWKTSTRAICTKDPFADDSFGLGILGSGWQHKLQNQQVFSFSSQTKIEITEAKKLDLKINAAAGGVGAGSTGMRSQVVSVENLVDIRGYSEAEETTESSHPYPELVQYIDEGVKAAITEFQNESDLDVLLVGPLGSGKTSFVWSVMRAFGR